MTAPADHLVVAHKMRDLTLDYLSQMACLFVESRGAVPLETFNLYLATLSRDDQAISEASSKLLNQKRLVLTSDRMVHRGRLSVDADSALVAPCTGFAGRVR